MRRLDRFFPLLLLPFVAAPVLACDLCAIYRATEAKASKEGWYAGAFEQFTRFGLQLAAIGQTKGKDTFQGEVAQDTAISQVTLGPEASLTWHENLSADLGVDFPVVRSNTSLQAVADYRVRAGMTWRF